MIIKKVSSQYLVDGKITTTLTEEVFKEYLLERQPIYFEYKQNHDIYYTDDIYYTEVKIYYGQMATTDQCHLGYEGQILLDKNHEGKHIGQWSTRAIVSPKLTDAYECFLSSLFLSIS